MDTKLYGSRGSPNVRGSMLALEEKGVAYEFIDVAPPFKAPDHMERHPFGRVPVLDHDGFMIYETQAIMRYLDQVFPGPALQPADARELARMNQVLGIVDCYLFRSWSGAIAFERLISAAFFGRPANEEQIAAEIPMGRTCADALGNIFAGPYLTGATYSLADMRLLPHYHWFRATPEGAAILAEHGKLDEWYERVSKRQVTRKVLAGAPWDGA